MTLNFRESCLTLLGISAIMLVGLFIVEMPIVVILVFEALFVGIIAIARKIPYSEIQKSMVDSVTSFITPILMLLLIGGLVASWIIGGTVPTLIYIGLKIIDIRFFLIITFLMCSLMSMLIGTSWGVMSTLGVAFIGISNGLGIEPAYTVSAIVSGAILGDKMSPMSGSVVMATEITGVKQNDGIKTTIYSNVAAFIASVALYIYLGLSHMPQGGTHEESAKTLMDALSAEFNLGVIPLLAPVLLIFLIVMKVPTISTFVLGIVAGVLESVLVQGCNLYDVAQGLMSGYDMAENPLVNELLHYGGFNSMASTMIMLLFAACFSGIIKRLGIIACLLEKIFNRAGSRGRIITAAVAIHTICFIVTGNYYTTNSILAPPLCDIFNERKVSRDNLAAVLLNAGTGISPIIPWCATAIFVTSTFSIEGTGYCIFAPIMWMPIIVQPLMAFMKRKRAD